MSVVYRAVSGPVGGISAASIDVPSSGFTANDLLLLFVCASHNDITDPPLPPSGWTLVEEWFEGETTSLHIHAYARVATGSEPANYTVTANGNQVLMAGIVGWYSGAGNVLVVDAHAVQDNDTVSTDHPFPSLSISRNNAGLTCFGVPQANVASTPDAAMTERWDEQSGLIRTFLMTETGLVAGATGARVATLESAGVGHSMAVAVSELPPVYEPGYRVGIGWDVPLADLVELYPAARDGFVRPTQRDHSDGSPIDQALYAPVTYQLFDLDEDYQAELAKYGLLEAQSAKVTLYAPSETFEWKRYNGTAIQPELGTDGSRTEGFLKNFVIYVKDLREIP